jgi:hypothetical protein
MVAVSSLLTVGDILKCIINISATNIAFQWKIRVTLMMNATKLTCPAQGLTAAESANF